MKSIFNLRRIITALSLLYIVTCFGMWVFQRHMIYHTDTNIQIPQAYGLKGFEDLRLKAADGTIVQAWHHPAQKGFPTVLYFNGNAGNLRNLVSFFRKLTQSGFGVLGLSYRGYGVSQGSPTEEGLYHDAKAVIQYAMDKLKLPKDKIILYGKSLGSGVAVQMAVEFPMAALVLQSPYTSIAARGQDRFPWIPVNLLIQDRFDSLTKIPNIRSPLLILHGEQDTIVPVSDGKTLFAAAPFPKAAVYFPFKNHNDLDNDKLLEALLDFAHNTKLIPLRV